MHSSPSSISQINFGNFFNIGFWAALVRGLFLPSTFSAKFSFCNNISAVGAALHLYCYGADESFRSGIWSLFNFGSVSMSIGKWQKQSVGFGSTFSFCTYTCASGADANGWIFVRLCDDRSLYCEPALFSFGIRWVLVFKFQLQSPTVEQWSSFCTVYNKGFGKIRASTMFSRLW